MLEKPKNFELTIRSLRKQCGLTTQREAANLDPVAGKRQTEKARSSFLIAMVLLVRRSVAELCDAAVRAYKVISR